MSFDAELRRHLRDHGVTLAQLEASVRLEGEGARADRVMIERAPPACVEGLRLLLGVPESPWITRTLATCDALALPLIAGWDRTRGCLKLYVNASDAPASVRREVAARAELDGAPHVLGLNLFAGGQVELKRYLQARDAEGPARRLVDAAGALSAGVVTSLYADGSPHAYFVALRPASPDALDAAFAFLPGFSWDAIRAHAPFEPASPRSIGVSAADTDRWTAYVKPRDADAPALWSLEPVVVVRAGETELAFFVAPDVEGARAYARRGGRALSYRSHGPPPAPASLEGLLDWALGLLEDDPPPAPPPPWRLQRGRSSSAP